MSLLKMRALGIHGQADGNSAGPPKGKKKRAPIFDATSRSAATRRLEVLPPRPILLERPDAPESQLADNSLLYLVIDEAGRVRSVEAAENVKGVAPGWKNAATTRKFIPAFKDGRPVASRVRIFVSPKQ